MIEKIQHKKKFITTKCKKKTKLHPIFLKKKNKDKKGFIFFCLLGKMFVSDTPCSWQKFCRKYQKLAFCS